MNKKQKGMFLLSFWRDYDLRSTHITDTHLWRKNCKVEAARQTVRILFAFFSFPFHFHQSNRALPPFVISIISIADSFPNCQPLLFISTSLLLLYAPPLSIQPIVLSNDDWFEDVATTTLGPFGRDDDPKLSWRDGCSTIARYATADPIVFHRPFLCGMRSDAETSHGL